MKTNYSELIELIKSLGSEVNFDNHQIVEIEHTVITNDCENEYIIELDIRRLRHLFLIYDTFSLSEEEKVLIVNYNRKTTSIIPLIPKPIPDKLERVFRFDSDQSQELIFSELMRKITQFFGEYNYVDSDYKIAGE